MRSRTPCSTPFLELGPVGNRATWLVGERLQRQTYTEPLRPNVRRTWSLPALPLAATSRATRWPPFPVAHAFSSTSCPVPADWPGHVDVTGWILPERRAIRSRRRSRRSSPSGREPPIYIGFGSMPTRRSGRNRPDRAQRAEPQRPARDRLRRWRSSDASALEHNPAVLTVAQVPARAAVPAGRRRRSSRRQRHRGHRPAGRATDARRPDRVRPVLLGQARRRDRRGPGAAAVQPAERRPTRAPRCARSAHRSSARRAERVGERITAEDGVGRAVAAVEEVLP